MNTLIVIFISVLVSTTTANHDAQPGRSKAFMDDCNAGTEPHLPVQMFNGAAVLVDST